MAIAKKQFGYHSKGNGDEWWFYLCKDTEDEYGEPFIIIETDFKGKTSERRLGLVEYLQSGERGRSKLTEFLRNKIDE